MTLADVLLLEVSESEQKKKKNQLSDLPPKDPGPRSYTELKSDADNL